VAFKAHFFNLIEVLLVTLILLNAVPFSNFVTLFYLIHGFSLLFLLLSPKPAAVKYKKISSIVIGCLALVLAIAKLSTVLATKDLDIKQKSEADFYQSWGIYFFVKPRSLEIDLFMSVFFDFEEFVLCLLAFMFYGWQVKQAQKRQAKQESYLEHPDFCDNYGYFYYGFLLCTLLDACFLPSLIQFFLICNAFFCWAVWAAGAQESVKWRRGVTQAARWVLIVQLLASVITQIRLIRVPILDSHIKFTFYLLGLEVEGIQLY